MNVKDCAAIITGGGSGMGLATATLLSEKGAKVALLGRRSDLIKSKALELGGIGIACDISQAASVKAALDIAEEAHGRARILIHCAAMGGYLGPFLKVDGTATNLETLEQMIQTNVMGTLYLNQFFAERLTTLEPMENQQRGVIVNVSSIGGLDGVEGSTYAMSKAAVNGLCLSLARELAVWKIRVATIAPGAIDTDMLGVADKEAMQAIESTIPTGRVGLPEEIAATAYHICENDYLNGSIFRVDGGARCQFLLGTGVDINRFGGD